MEQYQANDLLIFARVAERGSFSAAAIALGLPKATVSRRIGLLEAALGERLILRTTRRLSLTEFGQQLLEHARQVAVEVDAVGALREQRAARPSGRLRVSVPGDFANLLLTDMLAAFVAMHPAISLELDLSPRRVDLLGEQFDIAIRMGALADDGLLAARRIATLSGGLYAAPAYLAEHGTPASPEQLFQHQSLRLLGGGGKPWPWRLSRGEAEWQGEPPGRCAANSPELLLNLAVAGAGIAAVPDLLAVAGLRRGVLRRVLPDWRLPPTDAWAVFPGRKLMPAKTRAFLDLLHSALAPERSDDVPAPSLSPG
ncbi:MAG: LysR substrate-binding domain-containing protein [Lysobacterales bacterium]